MAQEWLQDVVRSVGDAIPDATQGWRAANRFGCMFVFGAVVGLLLLLLATFGGEPMRPGGWWVFGGITAVGVVGAAICFWLGCRRT